MDTPRSDRARRLGQVKFVALPLDDGGGLQEAAPPAEVSSARTGWRRALDLLLFRVPSRLAAARP